ncbi:MAG: SDR family NAD(P)-dependent oxidoreductase [Pseudomonadota bacterium]
MTQVITGAAHGLGRALALALIEQGRPVFAIDADGDALRTLPCDHLRIDLLDHSAARQIMQALKASKISRIIHCAGISGTGPFEALPAEHHAKIIALNFEAPVRLTCALLAAEAFTRDAQHVFVGSVSSFTGYPGAVSYAASKDGLASFAGSLDKALPKGQRASCVFPGPMATDHAARYAPDNSPKTIAARQAPEEAARLILKAVDKGRRKIVPGVKAKAFAALGTFAPALTGKLLKKSLFDQLPTPRI